MFKLVFSSDELEDTQLKEKLSVGRDFSNDVILPLPTVSGTHAELIVQHGKVKIVDLNSTNGTYVNGNLIAGEAEIFVGDNIGFDNVTARLERVFPVTEKTPLIPLFLTGINSLHNESFELNHLTQNSIGRDPSSDICLNQQEVSWHHANIYVRDGQWTMEDLDSTNGTFLNGKRIGNGPLVPGDVVSFETLSFNVASSDQDSIFISRSGVLVRQSTPEIEQHDQYIIVCEEKKPLMGDLLSVGRIEGNDVLLNNPTVSSRHAVLKYEKDSWWVEDLNSTNGTFVNAQKVVRTKIFGGDVLRFGHEAVQFEDPTYVPPTTAPSVVIMIGED